MRETVRGLAGHFPTAIISGRGREKVEGFVQLPELFYAGSHGMDIAGPTAGLKVGGSLLSTWQRHSCLCVCVWGGGGWQRQWHGCCSACRR